MLVSLEIYDGGVCQQFKGITWVVVVVSWLTYDGWIRYLILLVCIVITTRHGDGHFVKLTRDYTM